MSKTKTLRKISSVVLCFLLIMISAFLTPAQAVYAADTESDLPENIVANKESFDTIPDVINTYETKFADSDFAPTQYVTSVNGEKRIQRINFIQYDTPLEVDGQVDLEIPEDIARIFRLFGDLRLTGTLADNGVTMFIVDPDGTEHSANNIVGHKWSGEYKDSDGNPLWTTYTKMPWIQNGGSTIMTPWDRKDEDGNIVYSGYKLRLKGTGNLNFVYLWEENGMPTEYDISAYGVMGEDKPTLKVDVNVDTKNNLSINGVNKFDENVFKRYHVNSGPTALESPSGEVTLLDKVYHQTTANWGFIPGRGAFHFSLLSNLKEDASNPGWSDFTEVNAAYAKSQPAIDKMINLYPSIGKNYCLTLDGWPNWQWEDPNDPKMTEHTGTPAYKNFDAAADTAAKLIKAIDTRFDGLGPQYVEVKNESTISSEWNFFNTESNSSAWEKIAEFHNKVADAIKDKNPDVKVGGPSSAFMYLEQNDFNEAREQLKFMDATKDHLDWYSHHFYENSNLYVNGRKDNSDGFLCGRLEAVLDLLKAHMVNTDNVKPILITEEGTYNTLGTDIDYFQKLVAFNGYLIRFMDYADTIDMLVPYLYPIINWNPTSNGTFYKYNANRDGVLEEMTPLEAYLDMWSDFKGAYIPSSAVCVSEDPNGDDDLALASERIFTKAVRHGNKVYLAVQNFNPQRANLNLQFELSDGVSIASVTRKHFFLEKGKLTYEEENVDDLSNVPMRVQEMSVFEITLNSSPEFEGSILRKTDYAKEELVKTGENSTFTINTNTENLQNSVLRVDFGKSGSGFDGDMTVTVNGTEIGTRSLRFTNKSGDIFTFMNFNIEDLSVLQDGENTVTVSMPEGGTISSVQLMNYYTAEAPTGVDTSSLEDTIQDAEAKLDSVAVSETGTDVAADKKWVTKEIYDTLNMELKKAKDVTNDIIATEEEVETAKANLTKAMEIIDNNAKDPISGSAQFTPISFEDSETVSYQTPDSTQAEIVTELGVTEGTKALKYTVNKASAGFWTYKQLTMDCPDAVGWDISQNGLNLDITNPNDYKIQARIYLYDLSGTNGFVWQDIPANQTVTVSLTDFSPRDDWTENSYGYSNGIDAEHITKIGICFNEEDENFVPGTSMIIDNIYSTELPAVDTTALAAAINTAKAKIAAVMVSANGTDISPDKKWVTQADKDTYQAAIDAASNVLNSSTVTQEEVNSAIQALAEATSIFENAQKAGTKQTTSGHSTSRHRNSSGTSGTKNYVTSNNDESSAEKLIGCKSDTTQDLGVNGEYTFRITSTNGKVPVFVVGTPNVFDVSLVKTIGNDYFYKVTAIGKVGQQAGVYLNHGARLLVLTVKQPSIFQKSPWSDTNGMFYVKANGTYQFEIVSPDGTKPQLAAGSNSFTLSEVHQKGNRYYFKFKAIGKVKDRCGFYLNKAIKPVAIAEIK
jgi:hypothetical protein